MLLSSSSKIPITVKTKVPIRSFSPSGDASGNSTCAASLKNVLPALTGKGCDSLNIGKGDEASLAFFNIVMGVCTEEEKQAVCKDLEIYCTLDTERMIWIVEKLREVCS